MATNASDLSLDQLKRAVQIKEQILKLQTELSTVLGSSAPAQKSKPSGMSPANKARLSPMAKARWAKIKAGNKQTPTAPKASARKPMSPAQRAKIAARMKARWAKAKAAGKKSL
jgi:hypothetical protein